jgi:carbon-monoxide dehydrogenase medium subunit
VIPAAFDYARADSVDDAIALLAEHGDDAKLLAGGHSLLPLMKLRLATPTVVIDVGRVRDLSFVRDAGDHIAIGALTRHRDLETNDVLAKECGVLRAVAAQVGDNQVRHRARSAARLHGDPRPIFRPRSRSKQPSWCVARTASATSRRDFHLGFLKPLTRRAADRDPCSQDQRTASASRSSIGARDYAIVGVVAACQLAQPVSRSSTWGRRRCALHASNALEQGATPDVAAREAAVHTEPPADLNASTEYRTHLAQVLVRRALEAL